MKDKKIIVLAVVLLALVGYYVWYANKTKVVKLPTEAADMARVNPNQLLLRKVNKAVLAYKKEKGSAPQSLDELKGAYLDPATLKEAVDKGLQYQYVGPQSYRITPPRAGVLVAAKKTPATKKPGAAGGAAAAKTPGVSAPTVVTAATGWKYDPMGKPDPFKPFILARAQEKIAPRVIRRQLTPLQKMPLSEIQSGLKAIVWGQLGNKALVEDATGKGYVVQEGTYVGQHDGIVKKIYEDRIVVEEYIRDPAKGQLEPNEVVLKLKKVEAEQ